MVHLSGKIFQSHDVRKPQWSPFKAFSMSFDKFKIMSMVISALGQVLIPYYELLTTIEQIDIITDIISGIKLSVEKEISNKNISPQNRNPNTKNAQ
jgi:hypothetical protein